MSRLLRAAALLLFFFFPSLSEAATGTLAWAVTTETTPPLFLDTVGSGTSNVGHRSALDAAGNLYVAATTLDASGSCMVFLKYSGTDGQIAWRHDVCPGDTTTFASALVLDAAGDVLVAGAQSGSGYVAKLSGATGNPVWTQFIAPISSTSSALAIGVASSGDARVVASDGGNLAVYGFAGADGSLQFRNALTNGLGSAKLTGFAIDSGGASVVSEFDSDGNNTTAGRITRIDNLGSILWQVAAADAPVTTDASGNVIASSVAC